MSGFRERLSQIVQDGAWIVRMRERRLQMRDRVRIPSLVEEGMSEKAMRRRIGRVRFKSFLVTVDPFRGLRRVG